MSELAHGNDALPTAAKPKLVFFHSPQSGRCRRVEGFIAQVLQRRHNHDTFDVVRVSVEQRPDLAERFGVETVPTLCVVEGERPPQADRRSPRLPGARARSCAVAALNDRD